MTHAELGALIDGLYNLRQQRLELTREVDAMKAQETIEREKIRLILEEYGLAKASGAIATVGQTHKTEPIVTDWEEVHNYIRENNRFDLLQKRLSAPAWRELQEGGELVPGTEATEVWDLSLTKATR